MYEVTKMEQETLMEENKSLKKCNLIVVYSSKEDQVLMCMRRKPPYQGLFNFVGGKIEPGETGIHAAYRELEEETAITPDDIQLVHLADFIYYVDGWHMEVYVGKLKKALAVSGDENQLCWKSVDEDFFDTARYAGNGNIGHIMKLVENSKKQLLR